MNRPDLLIRQLSYYATVGCRHTIYVGDSSETDHAEQAAAGIRILKDRVNIVYVRFSRLNATQVLSKMLPLVKEPYATYIADDDFLVPSSLERCAQFLEEHPDFSTAHGVAALFSLSSSGAYGKVAWLSRYGQRAVEHTSARQRLIDYLENYYVGLFSVHRTEDLRTETEPSMLIPDRTFHGELLPCCLSILRGKAKTMDCLYLIRQAHDRRYHLPDIYDWITSPDWLTSYEAFRDCLAEELSRQDKVGIEEAKAVVKQAFWLYLGRYLMNKWEARYNRNGSEPLSRLRETARRIPGLRSAWHGMRSFLPGDYNKMSLEGLLRPSSPYHDDFMPIYRAITTPPAGLNETE